MVTPPVIMLFSILSRVIAGGLLVAHVAGAQQIYIPPAGPYAADASTLLLEHFDSSTTGVSNGPLAYVDGVFGKSLHLELDSWVSWDLGSLPEATVEFWGRMAPATTLENPRTFMQSAIAPFYAVTFQVGVYTNLVVSDYHSGSGWKGMGHWENVAPRIDVDRWHHYATTWGLKGFRFYVDGALVCSNDNKFAQNASTRWWAVGGKRQHGTASPPGFVGEIDELRISNIQRTFNPLPKLDIETAAVRVHWQTVSNVVYDVQSSSDFQTWSNITSVLGSGKDTNLIQWTDGPRVFYRVVVSP